MFTHIFQLKVDRTQKIKLQRNWFAEDDRMKHVCQWPCHRDHFFENETFYKNFEDINDRQRLVSKSDKFFSYLRVKNIVLKFCFNITNYGRLSRPLSWRIVLSTHSLKSSWNIKMLNILWECRWTSTMKIHPGSIISMFMDHGGSLLEGLGFVQGNW